MQLTMLHSSTQMLCFKQSVNSPTVPLATTVFLPLTFTTFPEPFLFSCTFNDLDVSKLKTVHRNQSNELNTSGMFCISNESLVLGWSVFSDLEMTFVSISASWTGRPMVMILSLWSRCLSLECVDVWHTSSTINSNTTNNISNRIYTHIVPWSAGGRSDQFRWMNKF